VTAITEQCLEKNPNWHPATLLIRRDRLVVLRRNRLKNREGKERRCISQQYELSKIKTDTVATPAMIKEETNVQKTNC
jgi:hypothetical protein